MQDVSQLSAIQIDLNLEEQLIHFHRYCHTNGKNTGLNDKIVQKHMSMTNVIAIVKF